MAYRNKIDYFWDVKTSQGAYHHGYDSCGVFFSRMHKAGGNESERKGEERMVKVNGNIVEGIGGVNLRAYLEREGYRTDRVVVEKNLQIVPHDDMGMTLIEDGDTLEIIQFVGGG